MKYSVRLDKSPIAGAKADEIHIEFIRSGADFAHIIESRPIGQRICFDITNCEKFKEDKNNFTLIEALCQKYNNLVFTIPKEDIYFIENFKKRNIPFYINIYINDWDTFNHYLSIGVTDIILVENMCFEIARASALAHANGNINIRVIPNVAQSSCYQTPDCKKFFIRPEDIDIYESYVDICEFAGDNQDGYYKIYAEDKKWYGYLNEIIIGYNGKEDNRSIHYDFAKARLNCGKRCFKGGWCRNCILNMEFSNVLHDRHIIIKTPPKKNN